MVLGGSLYTVYCSQLFFPSLSLQYTCSVLLGAGAAILWTAQVSEARYQNSEMRAPILNSGPHVGSQLQLRHSVEELRHLLVNLSGILKHQSHISKIAFDHDLKSFRWLMHCLPSWSGACGLERREAERQVLSFLTSQQTFISMTHTQTEFARG